MNRPYERVASSLRSRIDAGEWRPGEIMPARRALAAEYGVAAATLERAAGMLIAEGVLAASDRRGTFVADRPTFTTPENNGTTVLAKRREALHATVGIIAAVVPYESPEMRAGQWPAQILAECEHGLSAERGLTQRFLTLVPGNKKHITPAEAARQLLDDGIDALIAIGCNDLDAVLPLTDAAGIPLVCAEYDPVAAAVPQVYIDNVTGGTLALRHLRERGYRHLTFLRPFVGVWTEARLAGAQTAAGPGGLRVFPYGNQQPVTPQTQQGRAGYETGQALLAAGFEPGTGVIAPNDSVAAGFMKAAGERGLQAGRDYGLVGFDDYRRDSHLTSLRPPLAQLGREAAGLLVRLLRGEEVPARVVLQHRLIVRSSTLGPQDAVGAVPDAEQPCEPWFAVKTALHNEEPR